MTSATCCRARCATRPCATQDGGIVDDVTVYKFDDEHFMVVTSSAPRKKSVPLDRRPRAGHERLCQRRERRDCADLGAGAARRDFLRSVGRRAPELRWDCASSALRQPHQRHRADRLAHRLHRRTGLRAVRARRGGRGAVGIFERRGKEFGLLPYGVARCRACASKRHCRWPARTSTRSQTPFELGLDRWIRFDKREFVGREALLRVQERGISERWVGLVLDSDIPAARRRRVMAVVGRGTATAHSQGGDRAGERLSRARAGGAGRHDHLQRPRPQRRQDAGAGLPGRIAHLAGAQRDGAMRRATRTRNGRATRRSSIPPGCACAAQTAVSRAQDSDRMSSAAAHGCRTPAPASPDVASRGAER